MLLQDGFDVAGAAPNFATYAHPGLTLREMNSRLEVVFASSVPDGNYAGYKAMTARPTEGLCATADRAPVWLTPSDQRQTGVLCQ
jgi:hypothetical protein